MPERTFLSLLQEVMSLMNSDNVNTWAETVESEQVGYLIKKTYYEFINSIDTTDFDGLIEIETYGDVNKPTYMKIPVPVKNVTMLKYDCKENINDTKVRYKDIPYKDPHTFINNVLSRDSTSINIIQVQDPSGVTLLIDKTKNPSYYTSFDGRTLIFDSYKDSIEATLQKTKTLIYGFNEPDFIMEDSAVIKLDARYFPAFLSACTAAAYANVLNQPNMKEEKILRDQKTFIMHQESTLDTPYTVKAYGRRLR